VPNPPALAGDHQLLLGTAQRTAQRTAQSLRIDDGVVTPLFTTLRGTTEEPRRENEWGDGTVPSCSAEVPGVRPVGRLFHSHSDLGRADEVVRWVARILRDGDLGTGGLPLGADTGRIGLDTPDGVVVPIRRGPRSSRERRPAPVPSARWSRSTPAGGGRTGSASSHATANCTRLSRSTAPGCTA